MDVSHLDFDHLRPPKSAFEIVHKGDYMLQIEGKKYIRRIFYDVFYTSYEGDKLEEFRSAIDKANIILPYDWTSEETMKILYSGKFDIKKSLSNLKNHLEWRSTLPTDVPTQKALDILKTGVVYISGRDKGFRPVIVIDLAKVKQNKIKIEEFIEVLCFVLSVAKEFYFVHGKVENWIIIIETNGLGLLDFPFKVLKKIIEFTSIHFACTVEKIYVMNVSRMLNSSWSVIQSLIDPVTRDKITMIKKNQYSPLFDYIPGNQIEVKYGGTLPNTEYYWPPMNTLNKSAYSSHKKTYEETLVTRDHEFTDSHAWTTLDNVESKKRRSTRSGFSKGTEYFSQTTKSSQNDPWGEERSNRTRTHSKAERSKRAIESYELEEEDGEQSDDSNSPVANEGDFKEQEEGEWDECQRPHVSTFHSLRKYTMRLSTIREETFEEGPTSMIQDGTTLKDLTKLKSKQKSRKLMSQVLMRQASEKIGVSPRSRPRTYGSKGLNSNSFEHGESGISVKSELNLEMNLEGKVDNPTCCRWDIYSRRRTDQSESCSMF